MAARQYLRSVLSILNRTHSRKFTRNESNVIKNTVPLSVLVFFGGSATVIAICKLGSIQNVHAAQPKSDEDVKIVKLTSREKRFIRFASVEYDGQLYMTPQDFLESVVEAEPRPRMKRKFLTLKELEKFKDTTPSLSQGSPRLFRNLRDKGIISYTEYLFLLSILTTP